ncbi:MAG TPA: endoglucanase [Desulfonatronum sp.]|nr:endoglucanase [Desulfonatronum sp.]
MSRTTGALALLVILALGACKNLNESTSGSGPGLFLGAALDGYPITLPRLYEVQDELGIFPSMVVFFLQWPSQPGTGHFPLETLHAVDTFGALPCVTWEPMYMHGDQENVILAERILGGEYDPYIRDFARSAREYGGPFLMRFAHEMNLSRYHWGTTAERYGPDSPALYREMFQYVVRMFQEEGANNVLFVFCPNAESIPHPIWNEKGEWNTAAAYYPGHDYVDVLGLDGYNWGITQNKEEHGWDSTFRSFEDIMAPMHEELRALAPEKPIVVFETASTELGGDKSVWIRHAVRTMEAWGVAGFVWFEADKEVDWRLGTGTDDQIFDFLMKRISRQARDVLITPRLP